MSIAESEQNSDPTPKRAWQFKAGNKFGTKSHGGGRPRLVRDVNALARANTLAAFKTILRAMKSGIPGVELRAAEIVIERGWGKAPIKIDMEIQTFESFSPEARAAIDLICQLIAGQATTDPADALDITPTPAIESPNPE